MPLKLLRQWHHWSRIFRVLRYSQLNFRNQARCLIRRANSLILQQHILLVLPNLNQTI